MSSVVVAHTSGRTWWSWALAVAGAYQAAAVAGALAWDRLVPSAAWTRVGDGAQMSEVAAGRIFNADAGFVVIGALLGVVLGAVAALWRRVDPRLTVLIVGLSAAAATFTMQYVGLWIGPPDPSTVLAGLPEGASASIQLELTTDVALLVWPFASLMGVLLVLLVVVPSHAEPPAHHALGGPQGLGHHHLQ